MSRCKSNKSESLRTLRSHPWYASTKCICKSWKVPWSESLRRNQLDPFRWRISAFCKLILTFHPHQYCFLRFQSCWFVSLNPSSGTLPSTYTQTIFCNPPHWNLNLPLHVLFCCKNDQLSTLSTGKKWLSQSCDKSSLCPQFHWFFISYLLL
jgi:hypothetical protein